MPTPTRTIYVKQWREFRNMSQEELGNAIGQTGGNISVLERGLSNWTHDTLERIADVLECTRLDLETRAPQQTQDLWAMYSDASDEQRTMLLEVAKTILKPPGS